MAARKIDGWWYADFRVRGQRFRKRSPVNTKAEAENYERCLRVELVHNDSLNHLDPRCKEKSSDPTFEAFVEQWLQKHAPTHYRWSEQVQRRSILHSRLVPVLGRLQLSAMTAKHIDEYRLLRQEQGLGTKTINNHLTILRACLYTAVEWRYLATIPPFKLNRREKVAFRYLHPEESAAVVMAAPPGSLRTMIVMALRTGMRLSELIALRWEHIDFDTKMICIQRAAVHGRVDTTKNGNLRYLPIGVDLQRELALLKRDPCGRVFHSHGELLAPYTAWKQLAKVCKRAGVRQFGWHVFRHTFASDLARCGVSLQVIKELLGHSSIEMTMRYAHIGDDSLRAAVAQLGAFDESWAAGGQRTPETSCPGYSSLPVTRANQGSTQR